MILAIDIGNTHIAAGLYRGDELQAHWRLSSLADRTEDETWVMMDSICRANGYDINQSRGIAISSVVPDMTPTFIKLAQKYLHQDALVINHELELGIEILYHQPSNVGIDRLCNAVAGLEKYGGPLIIVDFGTATTFDVISKNAQYLGGIIAPGIETSLAILHRKAAKLPRVGLAFPDKVIGNSTEKSIQAGLMYGTVEMIDGLIERIVKELGEPAKAVATGGLSRLIIEKVSNIETVDSHLTLDGIRMIYEKFESIKKSRYKYA